MKALTTSFRVGLAGTVISLFAVATAGLVQTPVGAQPDPDMWRIAKSSTVGKVTTPSAPKPITVVPKDTAARVAALRVVNYQPRDHAWTLMWSDWRPTEFSADMARIKALGANAVRLCIYPAVVGWPIPKGAGLTHFNDALNIIRANGLQAQVTLFDWWTPYSDVASSQKWVTGLLAGHKDDARIAMVELINEVDPYNTTQLNWLQRVMPTLHSAVGSIPTTVSVSTTSGTDALAYLVRQLRPYGMTAADIHYYGIGSDAFSWIERAKAAAQGLPLFIGEAGYTTYRPAVSLVDQRESAQAQWFQLTLEAGKSLGVSVAPYMLWDLSAAAVPATVRSSLPTSELMFGLYRNDGTARPAAATVRAEWSGQNPTQTTFNTDFSLSSADGSPLGWTQIGNSGTVALDRTVGHNALGSVRFDNTGTDTVLTPSLLQPLPGPVHPGDSWEVGVSARTNHAGKIRVGIAWYDATGHWLKTDTATMPAGPLMSWQTFSVRAIVPSGAVQADAMLMDALNPGSVWFDDVTYNRISS